MKSFLKTFLASFLALIIFSAIALVILFFIASAALTPSRPLVGTKGVLLLDLGAEYREQSQQNQIGSLFGDETKDIPGVYDVVRMIHYAKTDDNINGIFIKADDNANGFATNEELRSAILDFKQSKKFVIAYGEVIPEGAYYVASAADKVYCYPTGGVSWDGFSVNLFFLKGLLDKLGIEAQVFYDGKFKSATEPFRTDKMGEANRLQTTVWLNDLYNNHLIKVAAARKSDTAFLHKLANTGAIQTAADALKYHLADGLKYDDEVKKEIHQLLATKEKDEINFVPLGKYAKAVNYIKDGKDKIVIIYAEGTIVNGEGDDEEISGEKFVKLIRNARLDDEVKAILIRVNSPGGSALASDMIWREISLARKTKPVVVSMGNYAASGGYYIACSADSIFTNPGTITGSIGVFSMLPNMQSFFKDKIGITFDGVKTAPFADMGDVSRPLTEAEKKFIQASVDSIYITFKNRVANGRKKDTAYIDSIAQGRVWTGERAINIGLADKTGTLQDALNCAARMAKTSDYRTREYPEKKSLLEQLMSNSISTSAKENAIKKDVGEQQYKLLMQAKKIKQMLGIPQAKLPFDFEIQ